jgi:hypothetical protein
MNFEFGMTDLVIIAAAVLLLSAFVASIAWVWRDADRRGQPGFIVAVLVAFLLWPFSLIVWLLARPQVGATPTAGRPLSSHEGIITLSPQVGATPTAGRQRGVCGVCGVVLLVVLLGIGIIIGGTIMFVKIRNYNGSTCLDQVSVIATAYLKYQDDNGRAPEYLAELGLRKLRCPSGTEGINIDVNAKKPRDAFAGGGGDGIPYQTTIPGGGIHVTQSGPSDPYELLPGTEPTDIIVREVWTNHGGKGGAIAFGDGSVAWVDSPYKPIRMDVVKAQVERQLREWFDTIEKKYAETLPEGLGEKSVRVGAVTFDPKANRYQVVVHWQAQGKKGRDTMSLNQTGQGGMSRYSGRFGLVLENVPASVFNPILPVSVDELMEREDWAEKN